MKSVMRLTLVVALLAMSAGMIVYSVKSVRYHVGQDRISELTMNVWSLSEGIVRDGSGNLAYRDAMINTDNRPYVQVASANLSVAISAMQSAAITATSAKKPAVKAAVKPAVKKPVATKLAAKKTVVKKPAVKKPAAKTPPKKTAPKPDPNAACPT
ncbi:MAG: hypothetical protein NT018_04950 [Armatimonadetes bacterium]|nr:hypothetical protein [Armatimonadota bacterium]